MNDDRAQLAKLGNIPPTPSSRLAVIFCIGCGRVYIVDRGHERPSDECDCGRELYPVSKAVTLASELRGGDGHEIRAVVSDQAKLWKLCQDYIDKQNISCPEAVYQNDNVALSAQEFVESVCELVGYHTPKEDE